jgi:uncharacterized protein
MSSNKPVPEMRFSSIQHASPDYVGLVRFLVEPFLETPQRLSVDCEKSHANERVWIRLAFEGTDKGRVFGRGGRNIQAIRTVIQAVAQASGQFAHLDIYESPDGASRKESSPSNRADSKRGSTRRGPTRKPAFKSRSE